MDDRPTSVLGQKGCEGLIKACEKNGNFVSVFQQRERKRERVSIKCNKSIHHEYGGRIENSVPRMTIWHHKACLVMTNGDPKGWTFLSYSHQNNGVFFLLTSRFHILFLTKGFQKFLNTLRCDML